MADEIHKWRINAFTCGVVTSAIGCIVFCGYLFAAYLGYISINLELWSTFYPGFGMDPLGLFIGIAWITLDAFFVGFGLTMFYNLISWFRDRSKVKHEYEKDWFAKKTDKKSHSK